MFLTHIDTLLKNGGNRHMTALQAAEWLIRVALANNGRGWSNADNAPVKQAALFALREHRSLYGRLTPRQVRGASGALRCGGTDGRASARSVCDGEQGNH